MPRVSFVIESYNHEQYVAEAIQSILDQTYQDFEIIITDDGSSDRTVEVIQSFDDPRIKLFCFSENQGACIAAKHGTEKAQGDFIARLSSDDVCYPHRLETQINFLDAHLGVSAVFSHAQIIDEHSNNFEGEHPYKSVFIQPNHTRFEWLRHFFFDGNCLCHPSLLIRRQCYEEIGMYDPRFRQLPDFDFWIRLCMNHEIHIIAENLVKFRVHSNESNASSNTVPNNIRLYAENVQILKKNYLNREVARNFYKIFPPAKDFSFGEIHEDLLPFYVALISLKVFNVSHKSFAVDMLYQVLENKSIAEKINQIYRFSYRDLFKIVVDSDVFNTGSIFDLNHKLRCENANVEYLNQELRKFQVLLQRNESDHLYAAIKSLQYKPTFSIIFPAFNTPEVYLKAAIESVINQVYPYWELCIADDKSTEPHVRKILQEYAQRDARIKIIYRTENGHISQTSNSAIEIATGEFIALLDHDDLLTSDALYEMALLLNQHPDADMIYSDEDKVNDDNQFIFPTNKPDWCPDSFLSRMYTCHLGVYRRTLINEIGGFRVGYEGSQDYDLVLRLTEKTDKIFHIPKILYHWRLHAGSTSASTTAKTYAYEAGFKALTDALNRRGENGKILSDRNIPGHYHARYEVQDDKLVSIIILVTDSSSTLDRCLESIFTETLYSNYEVIIIGSDLTKIEVKITIDKWKSQKSDRLKYYSHDTSSNSSELNNYAATKSQGDYLLFLSSDIQITQDDWLGAMVEQSQRESIGAVGAFLLDSYGTIQHVGSVLGLGEIASHIYKGVTKVNEYETLAHISLIKNVSVITKDCLMCRRDVFESIGGFDETLPAVYNEVDLCLSIIAKGYRNIILPHVKLTHQELTTWQANSTQKERTKSKLLAAEILKYKWGETLTYDPCISPHIIRDINSKIQSEITYSSSPKNRQIELSQNDISKPLVSVCIPTYNGAQFIEEAIESVLLQTYPNLEIIISDDSSTDRTVEIAKSFQHKVSCNLSILEHSQYGLSQNWNFCVSQAQGKYIKFLFQDDLLEPNAIEEMVDLAEQDESIGLVFSPRKLFTATDNIYYDSNFLAHHEAKDVHKAWSNLRSIQSGQELLQHLNLFDNPINKIGEPTTVLIKKEVFVKLGLFNPELCQLVDLEMWLRIMSIYKVGYVDKVLSHFRIHSQQQTQRNASVKETILLDYQNLFYTIYSEDRYPQSTREQALDKYVSLDGDLCKLRRQLVEQLLITSDDLLDDKYQGLLGKTHQILLSSQVQPAIWNEEEEKVVSNLLMVVSQDVNRSSWIQSLLAVMLYHRADRLPLLQELSYIPDWLLADYLKFLFSSPVNFTELGESDNYHSYLQDWMDYLYTSIFDNLDDPFWQQIVNQFAKIANFIPAYFNEQNLKDIYVKRAEIIELYLTNNGCEVDYEFAERATNRKKTRLGILASHFTPSAETFATLPIYEYLSREFEVVLYSLNQTNHSLEQYCSSSANYFVCLPQNLSEQVDLIRADDLDILFVATNVTAVTNQICLLATHRLARVQITSGGSVATTGIKNMDYFLSGTLTDPSPVAQEQYREKLIQLADSAHCFSYGNDETNASFKVNSLDERLHQRELLSISQDAVVFTSGANFYKITPELIHTWAKIIAEVPHSVLMLFPFGPNWASNYPKQAFEQHLYGIFAEYGVSSDRVLALDPQPVPNRADIKEYFKIADVYLDSYPFAGTTSLIEPLQVNLPVIARRGNSFRSAMGAAMIQSLDIPSLVADSEESYIQLAIELGNNPELRQQKRNEIELKMRNNPSFLDSRGYSAKIGDLFRKLLDNYHEERLNQNLRLSDVNLMVFPNWNQSEESVGLELQQVIQTLATQSGDRQTTLLIDTTNIAIEDAEMFISSVAMNLMMEADIDITEELEISLIEDLSDIQWETLMPRINARIVLECDNQASIGNLSLTELSQLDLESFMRSNQVLAAN
jgi:predicted O-linked N-acetylglucosamine transferase (SPINDLY family)/GT2 family glycosyltransferase